MPLRLNQRFMSAHPGSRTDRDWTSRFFLAAWLESPSPVIVGQTRVRGGNFFWVIHPQNPNIIKWKFKLNGLKASLLTPNKKTIILEVLELWQFSKFNPNEKKNFSVPQIIATYPSNKGEDLSSTNPLFFLIRDWIFSFCWKEDLRNPKTRFALPITSFWIGVLSYSWRYSKEY
jgi:hypothetical protein